MGDEHSGPSRYWKLIAIQVDVWTESTCRYFQPPSWSPSAVDQDATAPDVEEVAIPPAVEEDATARSVEEHSRSFCENLNEELK